MGSGPGTGTLTRVARPDRSCSTSRRLRFLDLARFAGLVVRRVRGRHVHDAIDWAADHCRRLAPAAIAWTPTVAGAIEHLAPQALRVRLARQLDHAPGPATPATGRGLRTRPAAARGPRLRPGRRYPARAGTVRARRDRPRQRRGPRPFRHPGPSPGICPPDGPIVGYVGKFGVRLDVPLIAATAPHCRCLVRVCRPALEPELVRPLDDLRRTCGCSAIDGLRTSPRISRPSTSPGSPIAWARARPAATL